MRHQIILLVMLTLALTGCSGSANKEQTANTDDNANLTEVLYFHGKTRCLTCRRIELLTQQVVDSIGNNTIVMRDIDISLPENQELVNQYEVSWSSLFVTHQGQSVNLTDMGFANAKNNPQHFKEALTQCIDSLSAL